MAKYHAARGEPARALECIASDNSKDAFTLKQELHASLGWSQLVNPRLVHLFFPAKQPMFVE